MPFSDETGQRDKVQYLIVGGAPKSGTTSLFRYLADHPQVCPANRKETYFFARAFDFKRVCTAGETLADFEAYFSHCGGPDRMRVEATPYTLYARGAAAKISEMIPGVKMLFVLRDPVERLISDYRFQRQRENPNVQQSPFADYVARRLGAKGEVPNTVDLGRYIDFLDPYFDAFAEGQLVVLFFEELRELPQAAMQEICAATDIEGAFYQTYDFKRYNRTVSVRYGSLNRMRMRLEPVVASIRARTMAVSGVNRLFERLITVGKLALSDWNDRKTGEEVVIPPETRALLADYYRPFSQALSEKLGRSLPWESYLGP